uniref:Reverse transcriptase domain-containing protein n=1 Tax=Tanacetum cinerariifolium TaxID=118510 RepID=A0A6L2M852_TANCI|nr:hypothetical protein [Tanacetum cinerariifolium]
MADNCTMEELLQAPTEGDVSNDVIKLMMFSYSLEGTARVWYDKEPPNSILIWEDLVNKFVNQSFPPSKTTYLKNEISRFTQRFEETFGEACERFKEMLRACPHHGFTELAQIDTFYNGLNDNDQDSINATAGGNLLIDMFAKKVVAPALVKAVKESCVTCGGPHAHYNYDATNNNQPSVCVAMDTYNQVAPQNSASNYMAPPGFAPAQNSQNRFNQKQGQGNNFNRGNNFHVERETKETTDKEQTNFQGSTAHIQPPVTPILELDVSKTLPKPNIPYPSRLNDQKLHEKATNQMEKFFQIFQDLHFDISFADALLLMPKFASTIKSLLTNKDKLFKLEKIPLNENCSAMLLKKLPERLGDPGKFLIPCDFPGMDVCHALADLDASINLMPLSIWKKLSLPELTPTLVTLDLAYRSIIYPKGVAEDVFVKVGKFHFPTDFVVVDFEVDPRVPLILGRSFWRTGRALIDVYKEEITLREYAQEILGFSKNSLGGNPTSTSEPILSYSSLFLTPFKGSDFILEKIEAYLKDESISSEIDHQGEVVKAKSSIKEPPELELKELPSHLEYAYLEGVDKLPVIISKDLKDNEKEALLKVLKSHKRAIAWKITDIKGIDPRFCTHKILMEEDYKPVVQNQRRVNLKIHEVIKKEVIKLLDAGMIYLIFDSLWVSPIHCVPKKGGITVVENENNELIPTRKKPFSPVPMEHLLIAECPLAFAMLLDISKKLIEAPILVVPDWNLPFELMCDASDFAIGAVLEKQKTKHFQPIHYASKTMTEAQIHYTTTEKEMLVVVYSFEKFRPYLVLSKSIVYTDHSALKYLLSKQDAKSRLIRWILLLQEFDIIIHDKKGTKNLAADHLSRLKNPHKDVFENKDIN